MASFLAFSAAFLAIISRFHLGISTPLGSWLGTFSKKVSMVNCERNFWYCSFSISSMETFFEKVPSHDPSGVEIPKWKPIASTWEFQPHWDHG